LARFRFARIVFAEGGVVGLSGSEEFRGAASVSRELKEGEG